MLSVIHSGGPIALLALKLRWNSSEQSLCLNFRIGLDLIGLLMATVHSNFLLLAQYDYFLIYFHLVPWELWK